MVTCTLTSLDRNQQGRGAKLNGARVIGERTRAEPKRASQHSCCKMPLCSATDKAMKQLSQIAVARGSHAHVEQ
jgi:hypothetical protein